MAPKVTIESGFAEVGAGVWLMGHAQPAAFFGKAVRRRRKGWIVRDRSRLDLVETTGLARLSCASRPFLTHIPCAATIFAVSDKVLVAPAEARLDAKNFKAIPFSMQSALCVTVFGQKPEDGKTENGERESENGEQSWVVMSTASRTARISVDDGDTLSVRPEAVVAWTGTSPTGFCPRLGIWDMLLPRGPKDLLFSFYGPCIVWVEGSQVQSRLPRGAGRCYYGV